MGFTQKEKDQIVAELTKKMPKMGVCPICHNPNWTLQDGLIRIVIQEQKDRINLGGKNFPCVAITCNNCGNTQLVNLIILGLRHLIEKRKELKGEKEERAEKADGV